MAKKNAPSVWYTAGFKIFKKGEQPDAEELINSGKLLLHMGGIINSLDKRIDEYVNENIIRAFKEYIQNIYFVPDEKPGVITLLVDDDGHMNCTISLDETINELVDEDSYGHSVEMRTAWAEYLESSAAKIRANLAK